MNRDDEADERIVCLARIGIALMLLTLLAAYLLRFLPLEAHP